MSKMTEKEIRIQIALGTATRTQVTEYLNIFRKQMDFGPYKMLYPYWIVDYGWDNDWFTAGQLCHLHIHESGLIVYDESIESFDHYKPGQWRE